MEITPDILATFVSFFGTAIVLFASMFAMGRWLDRKITDTRVELKSDIANTRAELKGDIANIHIELKGDIANTRAELKGDIANTRAELKDDIRLVRQNSEDAHREINERLRALKDQAHVVDKGLSTLTARVDCIDDKIDGIQRQLEEA